MAGTPGPRRSGQRAGGGPPGACPVAGLYDHGALGLDPLDQRHGATGNTAAPDRGRLRETQGRNAQTLLFQSEPLHGTLCIEEWGAAGADGTDGGTSKHETSRMNDKIDHKQTWE